MNIWWILIIILIIVAVGGYGWSGSPIYGGPYHVALPGIVGIIVIILVILLLMGRL